MLVLQSDCEKLQIQEKRRSEYDRYVGYIEELDWETAAKAAGPVECERDFHLYALSI